MSAVGAWSTGKAWDSLQSAADSCRERRARVDQRAREVVFEPRGGFIAYCFFFRAGHDGSSSRISERARSGGGLGPFSIEASRRPDA
jgi:hypothetical protein